MQPLAADAGAKDYVLRVDKTSEGDLAKTRELFMLVLLGESVDGELFQRLKWQPVHLVFDRRDDAAH